MKISFSMLQKYHHAGNFMLSFLSCTLSSDRSPLSCIIKNQMGPRDSSLKAWNLPVKRSFQRQTWLWDTVLFLELHRRSLVSVFKNMYWFSLKSCFSAFKCVLFDYAVMWMKALLQISYMAWRTLCTHPVGMHA